MQEGELKEIYRQAWQFVQKGQVKDALRLALRLMDIDKNNPDGHFLLGLLYGRKGLTAKAKEHLSAAIGWKPDHALAYYYLALILEQEGKLQEAIWALETANWLMPNDEKIQKALSSLYERVEVRGFGSPPVITVSEQIPIFWRVSSTLYLLLLTIILIGFYALSFAIILAFFSGGALVGFWVFQKSLSIHLAVYVGGGLIFVGWLMLLGLLRPMLSVGEPVGVLKTSAEMPRLWRVLGEVAHRVGAQKPDEVLLVPSPTAAVIETGGLWGLPISTKRCLILGVALLQWLTLTELKAVLAHELAHFRHKDSAWVRFVHHVTERLFQMIENVRHATRWWWINPAYWLLSLYLWIYAIMAASFKRKREFWADRVAASAYGSEVYKSALEKVVDAQFFGEALSQLFWDLVKFAKPLPNAFDALRQIRRSVDPVEVKRLRRDIWLYERRSIFATHPPLRERLARIQGVSGATDNDPIPALIVFEEPKKVEEEVSRFFLQVTIALASEYNDEVTVTRYL
ncbi:MAG: M48 family metalloprotease [Armatimonadota bacterium]|nr:M48 family metalloprotease [Armatimonadota bacterium]MDW8142266.1 M48 family metalloprotease [Armatimonadota bacterium]